MMRQREQGCHDTAVITTSQSINNTLLTHGLADDKWEAQGQG